MPSSPSREAPLPPQRADQLLSLAVIVRRRVVSLGALGTILLDDAYHASILGYHNFVNEILTI